MHNIWVSRQFRVDPFAVSAASIDPLVGQATTLRFALSSVARVSLTVVDGADHTVRTLVQGALEAAGPHQAAWDGRDDHGRLLPEGSYALNLRAQAPGLPPLLRGMGVTIDEVSRHGTLQIRVLLNGRPLPGATITIARAGSGGAYVTGGTTDRQGSARFSLSPGSYDVLAQTDTGLERMLHGVPVTRRSLASRTILLAPPSPPSTATATPTPGARAHATVTSTPKAPIAGSPTATPTASATPIASGPTDTMIPTPNARDQGVLALTVLLAPGQPADEAAIQITSGGRTVADTFTDPTGVLAATLSAGTYTVVAKFGSASGHLTAVQVVAGAVTRRTLDLQAGMLHVQVLLAPGHPADEALVDIRSRGGIVAEDYTDATGVLTATVNAGAYDVAASLGSVSGSPSAAQVAAGAVTRLTLDLQAGVLQVKVITAAGKPALDGFVEVLGGSNFATERLVDDSGVATFTLKPGVYAVDASDGSGKRVAHLKGITVAAGVTVERTAVLQPGA